MDDKISELKKQLDLILENYAVDKVKSESTTKWLVVWKYYKHLK